MVLNALGEDAAGNNDGSSMEVSTACNSSALLEELLCSGEIALFQFIFIFLLQMELLEDKFLFMFNKNSK